jgi:isoleucyl-tRNA synthetase
MGDELRFFFITSYARLRPLSEAPEDAETEQVNGQPLVLEAMPSNHDKCVRCWHHRDRCRRIIPTHPELCGRCVENVDGAGETGVCLMA